MALDKLNYEQFTQEQTAINTCISNIEQELNAANSKLNEATSDASGKWANTDIEDWNRIYGDINTKFARLQELMRAAAAAVQKTESTESAYSGFSNTTQA